MRLIMASERKIWGVLAVIRLVNAMLIQTYFVPDEYWQSVEVAHKMVFKYGYLTWEWRVGIRGFAYPLVFATAFHLLAVAGLDYRILLIKLPYLLQGILASIGDLYLFRLSRRLSGHAVAQWTLLCSILSWFMAYCCTRTLTNSTEMVFVTMALYYFPWPSLPGGNLKKFTLLAATAVMVRPTSAVLWLPLCTWQLHQCKSENLKASLQIYFLIGLSVLGMSTVIDRIFYDHWVVAPLNFMQFNIMSGGSSFYGTNPWHWYFSQGIPAVLGVHVVPFILGIRCSNTKIPLLLLIWFTTVLRYKLRSLLSNGWVLEAEIYSFLPHKEFRFLLPVLPLSMHYCGEYLHSICIITRQSCKKHGKAEVAVEKKRSDIQEYSLENSYKIHRKVPDVKPQDSVESPQKLYAKQFKSDKKCNSKNAYKVKCTILLLGTFNLLPFLYFSLIHQRGTVDVMNYLYDVALNKTLDNGAVAVNNLNFIFLMPCHSTPYYSFLHFNLSMRFLTCEPNLNQKNDYKDEAEIFFLDPNKWLIDEYKCKGCKLPTHIVYFNSLEESIFEFLMQNRYQKCAQYFHSHVPEGRIGSHVFVSCR